MKVSKPATEGLLLCSIPETQVAAPGVAAFFSGEAREPRHLRGPFPLDPRSVPRRCGASPVEQGANRPVTSQTLRDTIETNRGNQPAVAEVLEGELHMDWRERIQVDPEIMHGQACIAGTRIPVTVILDNLAEGMDADELLQEYPTLRREDVAAALAYAAELAKERIVRSPA